jgi:hypothetical protein
LIAFAAGCNGAQTATTQTPASPADGSALENARGPECEGCEMTPLIASAVAPADVEAVRGSDGRYHVTYELVLSNTAPGQAVLNEIRVVDRASGDVVFRASAKDLVRMQALRLLDREVAEDGTIPTSAGRLVLLSVSFPTQSSVPKMLDQRVDLTAINAVSNAPSPAPISFSYRIATVAISQRPVAVLSPPLRGKGWLASDGCCDAESHHINAIFGIDGYLVGAERLAIDWIQLDNNGRFYKGDPSKLTNWYGFGAPILASAGGVVTEARDGLRDEPPGKMPDLALPDIPGNRVVIDQGDGHYAVYAHLKSGSVAVKAGERVRTGQKLALLGSSGGSSAPHLHFHMVSGPSAVASQGVPYVLDSFALRGSTSLNDFVQVFTRKKTVVEGPYLTTTPQQHKLELPLSYTVVDFNESSPSP